RFGLSEFGPLLSVVKRNLDAEGDLIISTELRRVGPLPHRLNVEVRLEVLSRRVHMERLAVDRVLRGGEVWILRFGSGENVIEAHMERRFLQYDGQDVGR